MRSSFKVFGCLAIFVFSLSINVPAAFAQGSPASGNSTPGVYTGTEESNCAARQEFREEHERIRAEHEQLEADHDRLKAQCMDAKGQERSECHEKMEGLREQSKALHERMMALHAKMQNDPRCHRDHKWKAHSGVTGQVPAGTTPSVPTAQNR